DGGRSSQGVGHDVMELQERALRAPMSLSGDEGALASVAARHRALDVSRDIPRRENGRSKVPIRPGADSARPRLRGGPKLRLLDLVEKQGDSAVENGGRVAIRDLAAEKGLGAPQLLVPIRADRALDAVGLRPGGRGDRASRRY